MWPWLVSILNSFQPKEDDVSAAPGRTLAKMKIDALLISKRILCFWQLDKGTSIIKGMNELNYSIKRDERDKVEIKIII